MVKGRKSIRCRPCYRQWREANAHTRKCACGATRAYHAAQCMACRVRSGPRPRDLSEVEAAWLAGLIEGEGWIATPDKPLALSVTMTDPDVIEAVRRMTGVGTVRRKSPQRAHYQPSYAWQVHGRAVVDLLRQLRPWFHQRRGERADGVIAKYPFL